MRKETLRLLIQKEQPSSEDLLANDVKRLNQEGWAFHRARVREAAVADPKGSLMQLIKELNPALLANEKKAQSELEAEDYTGIPELEDISTLNSGVTHAPEVTPSGEAGKTSFQSFLAQDMQQMKARLDELLKACEIPRVPLILSCPEYRPGQFIKSKRPQVSDEASSSTITIYEGDPCSHLPRLHYR